MQLRRECKALVCKSDEFGVSSACKKVEKKMAISPSVNFLTISFKIQIPAESESSDWGSCYSDQESDQLPSVNFFECLY